MCRPLEHAAHWSELDPERVARRRLAIAVPILFACRIDGLTPGLLSPTLARLRNRISQAYSRGLP